MGKVSYWSVTLMRTLLVEAENETQAGPAAIAEAIKHPDKFEIFITFLREKTEEDEKRDRNKGD